MTWRTSASVDDFWAAAGEFLRSRPVQHTVPLTVVGRLRSRESSDAILGWWTGPDGGAFFQVAPYPLFCTALPAEAVPAAARLLADRPLPGVNALTGDAEVFADEWQRLTGATAKPGMRVRLWRLDRLRAPARPAPGSARTATEADRDLVDGRGYAAMATTTVTRAALAAGATDVVLATDLANPVSNALYQRLGYRPVEDRTVLEFTP